MRASGEHRRSPVRWPRRRSTLGKPRPGRELERCADPRRRPRGFSPSALVTSVVDRGNRRGNPASAQFQNGPGRDRTCDLGIKSAGPGFRHLSVYLRNRPQIGGFGRYQDHLISACFGGSCYHLVDTPPARSSVIDSLPRSWRHYRRLPVESGVAVPQAATALDAALRGETP